MSKRIINAKKLIDENKSYKLDDAISFFLEDYLNKYSANFNESIDCILKLGVDVKQPDQIVKGSLDMPNQVGKEKRLIVIIESSRLNEVKDLGATEVGSEDLIEKIKNGFLGFDLCIATPGMMSKVSTIGKILGKRGLMPNPKFGTVTDNVEDTVKSIKKGRVMFKVDKNGIIHVGIAKITLGQEKIKENIMKLYNAILRAKPVKIKGVYIEKAFLSVTHGPSITLDLKSFIV